MDGIVLVAAGGLAREAHAAAAAAGQRVVGVLDDDETRWETEFAPGVRIVGGLSRAADLAGHEFVHCAGRGAVRRRLAERMAALGITGGSYATIVHPDVRIPPSCEIGQGSILLAGSVLTSGVSVGQHVVCMPSVVLTHDCRLEDFATLCAGVTLGGGVRVAADAYLGMSCSVRQGVSIGARSIVGMGAVVLSDVGPDECVAGVPARRLVG